MDTLVSRSKKNAAICENSCESRSPVTHRIFERNASRRSDGTRLSECRQQTTTRPPAFARGRPRSTWVLPRSSSRLRAAMGATSKRTALAANQRPSFQSSVGRPPTGVPFARERAR